MICKRITIKFFFVNSQKRTKKINNELSFNLLIIRNRRRLKNMNEYEKKLNDVKKANFTNVVYHLQKLRTSTK